MDREIKFRAWDTLAKKMRCHTDPQTIQAVVFWNDYDGRIKIMQYTGLKDKNGVEIYEGDIIHFTEDSPALVYQITWNSEQCCFTAYRYVGRGGDHFYEHSLVCYGECEVIGNIHEHLELLEQL